MNILINHTMFTSNVGLVTEDMEYVLKMYCVRYVLTERSFAIAPQKIALPSPEFNHLMYDVISNLFDVTFKYAALGGQGCDMSLKFTEVEAL